MQVSYPTAVRPGSKPPQTNRLFLGRSNILVVKHALSGTRCIPVLTSQREMQLGS